jgi:hypothetical protein
MKGKPIILVDFDGVLHSYTSGWKGARVISDPPVPGALEFLINLICGGRVEVCIYSARSRQWGGRRAMKRWIIEHFSAECREPWETMKEPFKAWLGETVFADPWEEEVDWAARRLIASIKWPTKKPAAFLTLDDRCICFDGQFPSVQEMLSFKPWNKRDV